MTVFKGTSGSVWFGVGPVSGIKTWTIDIASAELDASRFGMTWKETESGLLEWTGSFEGLSDNDETQDALWQALIDGSTVAVVFRMNDGFEYFTGNGKIISAPKAQAHDAIATTSWSVKGTGKLSNFMSVTSGPMLLLMSTVVEY